MEPLSRNHASPVPLEVKETLQQRPPETRRATERVWNLLGEAPAAAAPTTDAAWADLERRLDEAPEPRASRAADRRPTRRRGWRLGAVTGLLLAVILAGTWWWTQPETVTVPYGDRQTVALPDGSQVHLNSGSRIAYARGFARWPGLPAGMRRVELQGEAFFDVVQDGRRFRIETASATIEVLGTRFNVRARRGVQSTQVTLEEGRVRVTSSAASDAAVVLSEAGQTVHVAMDAEPALTTEMADLDRALAWRQRGFVMDDEPIAVILQEVQRAFGVTIHVEGQLNLGDSMSIVYQRDAKVEDIIHDICLAQGCQYRRSSRGFTLSPSTSPGS